MDDVRVDVVEEERVDEVDSGNSRRERMKYVLRGCGLSWYYWMFLSVMLTLSMGGIVATVILGNARINTSSWIPVNSTIESVQKQSSCHVQRFRDCSDESQFDYRIQFSACDFQRTEQSSEQNALPSGCFTAYYGASGDYFLVLTTVRDILKEFKANETYVAYIEPESLKNWVRTGDRNLQVSLAYGVGDPTIDLAWAFVLVSTCFLWVITAMFILGGILFKNRRTDNSPVNVVNRNLEEHGDENGKGTKSSRRQEICEHIQTRCVVHIGTLSEYEQDCSICLEEFKCDVESDLEKGENDDIVRLQCAHVFHLQCMESWIMLGRRRRCPLCNYRLSNMLHQQRQQTKNNHAIDHPQESGSEQRASSHDESNGPNINSNTTTDPV
mmetsp:Transcript_9306/g.16758  ORF Transcript_9306/g.16758 Transcript_9306/m.16758 type:complete len:384 (-) Transcript_9306:217-1368(-)